MAAFHELVDLAARLLDTDPEVLADARAGAAQGAAADRLLAVVLTAPLGPAASRELAGRAVEAALGREPAPGGV